MSVSGNDCVPESVYIHMHSDPTQFTSTHYSLYHPLTMHGSQMISSKTILCCLSRSDLEKHRQTCNDEFKRRFDCYVGAHPITDGLKDQLCDCGVRASSTTNSINDNSILYTLTFNRDDIKLWDTNKFMVYCAINCCIKLYDMVCWINNIIITISEDLPVIVGDAFEPTVRVVVSNYRKFAKTVSNKGDNLLMQKVDCKLISRMANSNNIHKINKQRFKQLRGAIVNKLVSDKSLTLWNKFKTILNKSNGFEDLQSLVTKLSCMSVNDIIDSFVVWRIVDIKNIQERHLICGLKMLAAAIFTRYSIEV